MTFSWKDTTATVSMVIVVVFTLALMMGAFNTIDARWALGTFAVFLLGGVTGLITGTARMMQRVWSSLFLYVLSLSALAITIVNAFLNSEVWFVAMTAAYVLIWLEFVGIDLFSPASSEDEIHAGGAL